MEKSSLPHFAVIGLATVVAFIEVAKSFAHGPPNAGSRAHSSSKGGSRPSGFPGAGRHCSSTMRPLRLRQAIGPVRCAGARTTSVINRRSASSALMRSTRNFTASVSTASASERTLWLGAMCRLEHMSNSNVRRTSCLPIVFGSGRRRAATKAIEFVHKAATPSSLHPNYRYTRLGMVTVWYTKHTATLGDKKNNCPLGQFFIG
jgi:hypothetical protein